jgi:hypothetical protein
MKTNRPLILLVTFLFCWLGVACVAGAADVKGAGQSKQVVPAAAGPAKAVQVKDIQPQVVIISLSEGETWYGGGARDIQ